MATNFVSYQTCSLGAKVSQDPLDRFSQSLHHMVGIELQMIISFNFFRYLKGRRHGNQFSGKNGAKLPTPPAFIALSIQNGMGYRYLNGRVNSTSDVSISCKNFVNFGPATPEKTGLICILFYDMAKKLAYLSNISGYTGPIFTNHHCHTPPAHRCPRQRVTGDRYGPMEWAQ